MKNQNEETLVITRIFDAPREIVWKYWSEPEMFKKWWGPKNFSCTSCSIIMKIGGKIHANMLASDGMEHWSVGVIKELVPEKLLVYTDSFSNKEGDIVPASAYGFEGNWPDELLVEIEFDDYKDGKTTMQLKHHGIPGIEMRDMCSAGWNESFDKIDNDLNK